MSLLSGLWSNSAVSATAQRRGEEGSEGIQQLCERSDGRWSSETAVWPRTPQNPAGKLANQVFACELFYVRRRSCQMKTWYLMTCLQALKKNWDDLLHQYQGLSVVIDTTPKKYKKERLELEMKQLERDIDLIERHKTIYIAN